MHHLSTLYECLLSTKVEQINEALYVFAFPLQIGDRKALLSYWVILHVFKENKGPDKTEIIILDLPKHKTVQWDGNASKQMENLKILVIINASFSRERNHLPNSLRVLKWRGYPESSLPAHFNPKKLVTLDLYESFITFEKQPIMKFKSLTEMDLTCCKSLKQVPDMSGAQNLKRLNICHCRKLVEVHDSVGLLGKLEYLDLHKCKSLGVLPRCINLPSLQYLSLEGCRSLKSFPEILDKMEKLTKLRLGRSGISELPFSIGHLVLLDHLDMPYCDELLVLPSSIFMLPRLGTLNAYGCAGIARINKGEGICQELETMSSDVTTHVDFNDCHLSDEVVATLFPFMQHVSTLNLNDCNITVLPSSINACSSMNKLTLNNCKELREIRGEYFEAKNCSLLSSQSKEILLNQMVLNSTSMVKLVCFPGSTIPWWSNPLYRSEQSLSFLFRNKFPAIALRVAGVLDPSHLSFSKMIVQFEFDLIINGSQWLPDILRVGWIEFHTSMVLPNNIIVLHLRFKDGLDKIGKLHFENEWNLAAISLVNKIETMVDIKWMRVHVLEQETNMEDVQIINPAVPVVEENKENGTHDDERSRKKVERHDS